MVESIRRKERQSLLNENRLQVSDAIEVEMEEAKSNCALEQLLEAVL
jgi:hypothetical protein